MLFRRPGRYILVLIIVSSFFTRTGFAYASEENAAIKRVEELKGLISKKPQDKTYRKELAGIYLEEDMPDKAVEEYKEILKIDPDDLDAKEAIGLEYLWNEDYSRAEEVLSEVVRSDPDRLVALNALDHLRSVMHDHHEKAGRHGHMTHNVKSSAEELETYKKLADSYIHASRYEKARKYYLDILRLNPGNVRAQRKLDRINRLMEPQVFTQMDFFKVKGDATHFVQTYGSSIFLEDGYIMENSYVIKRRTQEGIDRYTRQAGTIEISKSFTDDLVLFGGAVFKYYSEDEPVVIDYYFRLLKSAGNNMSFKLSFQKEHEDSKKSILEQRVDRYGISAGWHWNLCRYFSFDTDIEGSYYTKGYTPNNNASLSLSASPIVHVLRGSSILDVSYTYHRLDSQRKSITRNNVVLDYNYYSPRVLEIHSGTVYASREFFYNRFKAVFSDTFSYRPHDETLHNMIYTEVRWKISDNNSLSGVFTRKRVLRHVSDSFQKSQQFTVKFSHIF